MKKLILIFSLFLFVASVFAQDVTRTEDLKPAENYTIWKYDGVAGDTVSNNGDSLTLTLFLNKPYPVGYNIYLDIDTVSSSSTTIKLQGRTWEEESWTDISSVSFGGTDDTTFSFLFQNEISKTVTKAISIDTAYYGSRVATLVINAVQDSLLFASRTDNITINAVDDTINISAKVDTFLFDTTLTTKALGSSLGDSLAFYQAYIDNIASEYVLENLARAGTLVTSADTAYIKNLARAGTVTYAADTVLIKNAAQTFTESVTTNVKFYRYLRVLLIESGTGKTELQKCYFKIWRREN